MLLNNPCQGVRDVDLIMRLAYGLRKRSEDAWAYVWAPMPLEECVPLVVVMPAHIVFVPFNQRVQLEERYA